MKAINLDVNLDIGSSFSAWYIHDPCFIVPWHKHEEIELFYILEGYGTRYVGDSIQEFNNKDLVLLGSNVPHYWKSDEEFEKRDELNIKAYCLTFHIDIIQSNLKLPEFQRIKNLLEQSRNGLKFSNIPAKSIKDLFLKLVQSKGALRFVHLFQLLHELTRLQHEELISHGYSNFFDTKADERLNKVFEFIEKNFKKPIYLESAASIANMSPNAFSRFFKGQTNKTFSQFLIEMRVGYACKLLRNPNKTISNVAFESGFSNHSNFDKQFKKIKGKSPNKYRKEIS